jgi:hypothetical protein
MAQLVAGEVGYEPWNITLAPRQENDRSMIIRLMVSISNHSRRPPFRNSQIALVPIAVLIVGALIAIAISIFARF